MTEESSAPRGYRKEPRHEHEATPHFRRFLKARGAAVDGAGFDVVFEDVAGALRARAWARLAGMVAAIVMTRVLFESLAVVLVATRSADALEVFAIIQLIVLVILGIRLAILLVPTVRRIASMRQELLLEAREIRAELDGSS